MASTSTLFARVAHLEQAEDDLDREEDSHGAHVEHIVHSGGREGALEVVACGGRERVSE